MKLGAATAGSQHGNTLRVEQDAVEQRGDEGSRRVTRRKSGSCMEQLHDEDWGFFFCFIFFFFLF